LGRTQPSKDYQCNTRCKCAYVLDGLLIAIFGACTKINHPRLASPFTRRNAGIRSLPSLDAECIMPGSHQPRPFDSDGGRIGISMLVWKCSYMRNDVHFA